MIKDDKQRVIGKLVSINSETFTVELLNQSINFTVNGFDDIYHYAQINGYVILPYLDYYIVAEIFGIRERDADTKWKGEKEQILSKSNSVKYIDVTPIGTIQERQGRKKFRYGLSIFPTLYTDVLYIKREELDIVFEVQNDDEKKSVVVNSVEGTRMHLLEIGNSTIFPDYKVKIDINGFFGHHAAVLGNTGSGKSCTISSMLQTLCKKENFSAVGATFVFFDVNGEYHRAFSQITNPDLEVKYYSLNASKSDQEFNEMYALTRDELSDRNPIDYNEFKLPHWFLNIDEWAMMLHASEKTQLPILRSSLGFSQSMSTESRNHIYASNILYVFENWESTVAKRQRIGALIRKGNFTDINIGRYSVQYGNFPNVDEENTFRQAVQRHINPELFVMPKYSHDAFDFDDLEDLIEDAVLYEEYHGNKQIRDYCSSMVTRYKSLRERKEFEFMTRCPQDISKEKFIQDILGLETDKKKTQISIIDLNSIDDEVVELISCVACRLLFETLKNKQPRNKFPVNIVLEEAHRYISEKKGQAFGDANKIFERIAKEGRKYGMFLLISSQRPSELSKTVLSQCSNFIVHRIQNPEDLAQIRQMTPHISSSILGMLPSIPRQHALVFGHSVQIPTLFKVNEAAPTPHSNDNDVVRNWFKPKDNFVMSASANGEVSVTPGTEV
ncbi:MAG: ATP-binding protein [Flavisolibacter sp.]